MTARRKKPLAPPPIETPKWLDGWFFEGDNDTLAHRVMSGQDGEPKSLCGHVSESWRLDQERMGSTTCAKCLGLVKQAEHERTKSIVVGELTQSELRYAEGLVHDDPGGNIVRRVAFAVRDARRETHHLTGEMQDLCDLAKQICQGVPLGIALPEQLLIVRKFRELVARLPERYAPARDLRREAFDDLEKHLRSDFEEPFSLAECFEAIAEVRGGR